MPLPTNNSISRDVCGTILILLNLFKDSPNLFTLYLILKYRDVTYNWNHSPWKTGTHLTCIINNGSLITWRHQVPGHQQPWYCLGLPRIFWFRHPKGNYMGPGNVHYLLKRPNTQSAKPSLGYGSDWSLNMFSFWSTPSVIAQNL